MVKDTLSNSQKVKILREFGYVVQDDNSITMGVDEVWGILCQLFRGEGGLEQLYERIVDERMIKVKVIKTFTRGSILYVAGQRIDVDTEEYNELVVIKHLCEDI